MSWQSYFPTKVFFGRGVIHEQATIFRIWVKALYRESSANLGYVFFQS